MYTCIYMYVPYIHSTMKKEHQEELSKLQEQLSKVDASFSGTIEEKPVKPSKGGKFNIRKNAVSCMITLQLCMDICLILGASKPNYHRD